MKIIARLLKVTMCYLITSCAHPTPKEWWPSTHKDMMGECQGMCKGKVESYEAWTASCKCKQ